MKSTTLYSIQATFTRSKVWLSATLTGVLLISTAIFSSYPQGVAATVPLQKSPTLIATAYTDITLPTLSRGDRGRNVQLLQKILSDNNFLEAAGVRLGSPQGAIVDGVFGPITESAVRDLQQRYHIPATGRVNPQTWEVLDMNENQYRSPLPWKS